MSGCCVGVDEFQRREASAGKLRSWGRSFFRTRTSCRRLPHNHCKRILVQWRHGLCCTSCSLVRFGILLRIATQRRISQGLSGVTSCLEAFLVHIKRTTLKRQGRGEWERDSRTGIDQKVGIIERIALIGKVCHKKPGMPSLTAAW